MKKVFVLLIAFLMLLLYAVFLRKPDDKPKTDGEPKSDDEPSTEKPTVIAFPGTAANDDAEEAQLGECAKKFANTPFTCKTDSAKSILFREDGTAEYFYHGESEECTWEVIAQKIIRLKFDGYDKDYYIFHDGYGAVDCISESPDNLEDAFIIDYPER